MKVLKLKYCDGHIWDKKRFVSLILIISTVINNKFEICCPWSLYPSMINMLQIKKLKHMFLSLELSLASSLNLVVRGTRYKRTKYKGGCGKSDAIVTVTKRNLHFQNFWGSVHKQYFYKRLIWKKLISEI